MGSLEKLVLAAQSVSVLAALLGGLWQINRVANRVLQAFTYFAQEHELLMQWWAKEHNVPLQTLVSRIEPAPWWRKPNK